MSLRQRIAATLKDTGRRLAPLVAAGRRRAQDASGAGAPVASAVPVIPLTPATSAATVLVPTSLPRTSDALIMKVSGEGLGLTGGGIVRIKEPGLLLVELDTRQHLAEPVISGIEPEPFAKDVPLAPVQHASRPLLVVELPVGRVVPLSVAGVLNELRSHLLHPRTRLGWPAGAVLSPTNSMVLADVPVDAADPTDAAFRELWHMTLLRPAPRTEELFDRAEGLTWTLKIDPDVDPPGDRSDQFQPAKTVLEDISARTQDGAQPLVGSRMLLSGGGAAGVLTGVWTGPSLAYRESVVTGRTTDGMTAQEGLIYPFGLRAIEVVSWARRLTDPSDRPEGAYLQSSAKIVFLTSSRDISGSRSPFRSVEVVNAVRDGIPTSYGAGDSAAAHPVPLISYRVTDRAGTTRLVEVPGYFVAATAAEDELAHFHALYAPSTDHAPVPPQSLLSFGTDRASLSYWAQHPSESQVDTLQVRLALPALGPGSSWQSDPPPPDLDWAVVSLSQVSEFTGRPATTTVRYPSDLGQSRAFLRPVAEVEVALRGAGVKSGVFFSPSYGVDSIEVGNAPGTGAACVHSAGGSGLLTGADAPRILGFSLAEFTDPTASPVIAIVDGERMLSYSSPLHGGTQVTMPSGLTLSLTADQPESAISIHSRLGPDGARTTTSVSALEVVLAGALTLPIRQIILEQDTASVSVKAWVAPLRLTGHLSFVQSLFDALPDGLFGEEPKTQQVAGQVQTEVVIDLPSIGFGVFSLRNLTIVIRAGFDLAGGGVQVTLGLGSAGKPFAVGVGIFVGGGYLSVAASITRPSSTGGEPTTKLSAVGALELGAGVSVDLALASGTVEAVAGIEVAADAGVVTVSGYVRILGVLRVRFLGSVSMAAELKLTYTSGAGGGPGVISGSGHYTISIDTWLFDASVSVRFTYSFDTGNADPPLLALLDTARGAEAEWDDYWSAFGWEEVAVS